MRDDISEITEQLQDSIGDLIEAVDALPKFTVVSAAGEVQFDPFTVDDPPGNHEYIYIPNLTTRGASSKRTRFLSSMDSHMQALEDGYCFRTEEQAKAAAQIVVDMFFKRGIK